MKSLVPAAYAQFGVGAGRRCGSPRVCDGRAPSNGMEDPTLLPWRPAVVHRRTPPVVKRPVYEADDEPAMRCYPALRRERCVQRSLPCVNRSGKKSYASRLMALSAERFLWKDCLQKRIRTGKSRCGNHLGCPCGAEMGLRYGLSGNRVSVLETGRLGYERETASSATRGSSMWKTNPT